MKRVISLFNTQPAEEPGLSGKWKEPAAGGGGGAQVGQPEYFVQLLEHLRERQEGGGSDEAPGD